MKRFLLFIILFVSLFLPQSVFAHVLKTDGDIGAVVHIDPEDDPIAGETTTIYFDVKDKTQKFRAEDCTCIFVVKEGGREVFTQPLNGTSVSYNFPNKNVYLLELRGQPKVAELFQPFTLNYEIRVERSTVVNAENEEDSGDFISNHIPHILVVGVVLLFCGFIIFKEIRKAK